MDVHMYKIKSLVSPSEYFCLKKYFIKKDQFKNQSELVH